MSSVRGERSWRCRTIFFFIFLKDLLHTISNTEERRLKKEMIRIDNQGQ